MNPNIFSDLRKPGLVPGESLSLSTKIDSVLENNLSYIMTNRMRSIHMNEKKYFVLKSSFHQLSNMASSGTEEDVYIHNFLMLFGKKFSLLILLLEF